jgi:hypothetical protein
MEIAKLLAGYSLGEADMLRRAMGKKIRAEMDAQRARFVSGSVERGLTDAKANEIFDLLAKFADYGFNKSHAAAYALLTYQTAYLKANHPVEFLAAAMTLDIDVTDKLAEFRQDAQRLGITVEPPSINGSGVGFGGSATRSPRSRAWVAPRSSRSSKRGAPSPTPTSPASRAASTRAWSTSARWRTSSRRAPWTGSRPTGRGRRPPSNR